MKKSLSLLLRVTILFAILTSCAGPQATPEPPEDLSVQVDTAQVGPQIVSRTPLEGQRLDLEPAIQIVFDRAMQQDQTGAAWSFLGPDQKPVPGKISWLDSRTFEFRPESALQPATVYQAEFSTKAAGQDGVSLAAPVQLEFETIESLTVAQVFPASESEDVDSETNITVIFNRPIVPLTIVEEQDKLPQPLEFSPTVKGTGEWVNSSVYVFQPEEPLLTGTRYTVRVDTGLKDTSGNQLKDRYIWQFSTRAPRIGSFYLKDGPWPNSEEIPNVLLDQAFIVDFLQPMDIESMKEVVTLVNRETGKPFPIKQTWNKDQTEVTIEPVGRYQIASFYDLAIPTTARALDGGTLQDGLTLKLSTIPLPSITNINPDPKSKETEFHSYFQLSFASPMKLDSLKSRIQVTPEPPNGLEIYYNDYNWELSAYGLQPATEYVVRILPGMSDIYGNTIKNETSFTITTGDLRPYANIALPWAPLVYRAGGEQEVHFEHSNLDSVTVSLYPLEFDQFIQIVDGNMDAVNFNPTVQPIHEWTPDTSGPRNQVSYEKFTLEDRKGNPLEPGYYFIGVKGQPLDYDNRFYEGHVFVVATDNLTLKTSATEGLAWLTDLESGKPQSGETVTFYNDKGQRLGQAKSSTEGLAYLDGLSKLRYARAEGSGRVAFTALDWGSGVSPNDFGLYANYYGQTSGPMAYIYTDRPLYRPGQEVYFKGIVRQNDDLHYSLLNLKDVYVTIDHNGEQVYAKNLSLSELGSISGTFNLSDDASLGTYNINIKARSSDDNAFASQNFRVADYRKPEFQVSAAVEPGAILSGDQATFSLDATYYSGGNVANANVDWFIEASNYYFTPSKDYSQYSFSDWDRDIYYSPENQSNQATVANGQDATDENGHLDITRTLDTGENKVSRQVTLKANVTDIAGNLVSGSASLVVHQSQYYAGIRSERYVGVQGEDQPFQLVVLDWDSKPVADQNVTVKFIERRWFSVQKQDEQGRLSWETSVKEIPAGQASAVTGEDGLATVNFVPPRGGVYKAIATVRDEKGNSQQSSTYIWVSSNNYVAWRQTNDRAFNLIADKDNYEPGDTAEILIAQPFEQDVYALVTYERGHIYKQEVVQLKGNSTIYKLPITGDMAPMSYVTVTVVQGASQGGKPDFKVGMARINVDLSKQTLDVSVSADKKTAGPGDKVTYTVTTKDLSGKPVKAEVSLAVVDKAVLALAPANSGPILGSFYPEQALSVRTALGIVQDAEAFNAEYVETIPEGLSAGGGGSDVSLGVVTVRQDFKDTAYFEAQATTDEKGQAKLTVKLPENLTTWQADARAVTADSRVGQSTSELVSTKPVFIQIQAPRFFVSGDQAKIGVTVHNNISDSLTVQVTLEGEGVALQSPPSQSVTVPGKQQAFLTWDATVDPAAERVDLTASAISGKYTDSTKPSLGSLPGQGIPVYRYTATETVGTSGLLDSANSVTEGIQLPTSFDYTDAQLSVEVAPSLAASMQDSLTYLQDYPYLCLEQTVSRFLPNIISARALKMAGLPNLSLQSNLDNQVGTALQRIYAKQNYDGGWNWWDGPESDPYTSAYVVFGILEAKDAGYSVSSSILESGVQYLKENLPDLKSNDIFWQYNRHAFMLYVLARAGELGAGQTNYIYQHRTSLSLYGEAYLAQALYLLDPEDERISSLMSDLADAAVLSAAGTHWEESHVDYWNWNTDLRTTAIVLSTFVQIEPKSPLTANAVRWLMAHRQSGHWPSTQETVWSLIALTNWMAATDEFQSNYSYAIGLNGDFLDKGQVTRDSLTEAVKLKVAVGDLLKDELNYLVFTRGTGDGNLYYTAYLNTTLPVEQIQPLDQGISLSRQYFTLDDPKTPITEIKRGELVRVRLTIVAPDSLHYVVINDPLPAGLEAIDASLATDTAVPSVYTKEIFKERGWGWWYFSHAELRDEKVVLSSDYLPAGTYVYTYLARASTAGTFKVIPSTANEFYFPDVAGRGAGSLFSVKP